MKKLLLFSALLLKFATGYSQYMDRFHSNGADPMHIYYNAASLSGTNAEFVMFPDTIPAGTMYSGKQSYFFGSYKASTGVSLSDLTIKIKFGSSSLTILNGIALTPSISNRYFTVEVWMDGELNNDHQMLFARVISEGGVVLSKTTYMTGGDFYEDPNTDQRYHITMQVTGVGYSSVTITPQTQWWRSN